MIANFSSGLQSVGPQSPTSFFDILLGFINLKNVLRTEVVDDVISVDKVYNRTKSDHVGASMVMFLCPTKELVWKKIVKDLKQT